LSDVVLASLDELTVDLVAELLADGD
jgi:hypothetical protein